MQTDASLPEDFEMYRLLPGDLLVNRVIQRVTLVERQP
jgi:hypothetical protein